MEKQSFREYHKGKPSDPTIKNIEQYLPFGEIEEKALIKGDSPTIWRQTLVDEHLNSYNTPYKFNGKELDEETGNYYYGARYYNPKWSIWIGVDPLAEKTMSAYDYCYNNPINMVDPTGMSATDIGELNIDTGELKIIKNNEIDRMYLVNKDGERIKDENGNDKFFEMEYEGQIQDGVDNTEYVDDQIFGKPIKVGVEFYNFDSQKKAKGFYEFLSGNQNTINENELFEYEINGEGKGIVARNLQFEIDPVSGHPNSYGFELKFQNFDYRFRANMLNQGKKITNLRHSHSHESGPANLVDRKTAEANERIKMSVYFEGQYYPLNY